MPHVVQGNPKARDLTELKRYDYDYDYPDSLDLRIGSEIHSKIVTEVMLRADESANVMKRRFDSWNEIDSTLTSYIALDDKEKDIKADDGRKPVSIVYPYSYAILETLLSYLVAAFLEDPIFRYEGVSPEDTLGAIMLEKVVGLHCHRFKLGLALHTMFRDALAYGIGATVQTWKEHRGMKIVRRNNKILDYLKGMFVEQPFRDILEDQILFEGNAVENIDPYLILPDPNIPIHKAAEGEFFGWIEHDNFFSMLKEEETDEDIFNVRYLEHLQNRESTIYLSDKSMRDARIGGPFLRNNNVTKPVDSINMYFDLIPKDWKLGTNEYPEKWFFRVSADSVVTMAKPLGLAHNTFPISITAPDFDGYGTAPISRIETLYGMQGVMDWLLNSHIQNVRKAINDMFVVDPYMVNIKDIKTPGPGKLIRLRRPAWGKGVKDTVAQLGVNDFTANNISDVGFIAELMQRTSGANDPSMGSLRKGGPERLTSREFQGTQTGLVSRLDRLAKVIGLQGMHDIGLHFAYHTQQFMSQETYVKVTGRWHETLVREFNIGTAGKMKVTPYDLLIGFDTIVRDGSVPGGNFSEVWVKMFDVLASHPELNERFDLVRIFKYIARNAGAKNVDNFVRVQTLPTQMVDEQSRQGNIVPIQSVERAA